MLKQLDHVEGGELSVGEVQKARHLEVEYLNTALWGLSKQILSLVAPAQWDPAAWFVWTQGTREQLRDRDDAHRHQQSVLSRSKQ